MLYYNNTSKLLNHLINEFAYDYLNNADYKLTKNNVKTLTLKDEKDCVLLEVLVPGYSKEDINIEIENDTLKIYSEKELNVSETYWKNFNKEYNISKNIDVNKIEAKLENGILYIKLFKKEYIKSKIDIK